MIAVSFMPAPIPNGEAEEAAAKNFMWPNGAEQVKGHVAHLLIAVMGKEISPIECGTFLAKTVTSACKQDGVLGIYTGEVVYAPDYYQRFFGMLEEDLFPIYNLVWIGLYNGKKGLCAYTGCGTSVMTKWKCRTVRPMHKPSTNFSLILPIM